MTETEILTIEKTLKNTKNASSKKMLTTEEFIRRARIVHGDKYDYSKVEYKGYKVDVCIICPIHGEFWQTPSNHLSGKGCRSCQYENLNSGMTTFEDFVVRANKVHNFKYKYIKKDIKNQKEYIQAICPIHGIFKQEICSHLHGHGCQKCGVGVSLKEQEIIEFLKENHIEIEERRRNLIEGSAKEIDIYIPSKKIGIEFNGLRWHSDEFQKDTTYHQFKTDKCQEKGIRLIQIFEDEWTNKKEITKSKLLHILGINSKPKIMGRKVEIKEISKYLAKKFINSNSISDYEESTINIGAFYNNKLIGAASLLKKSCNTFILTNISTDINYICQGLPSKLLKYFERNYTYDKIITFSDRRWVYDDNLYSVLGFHRTRMLEPSYTYRFGNKVKRVKHFNFEKLKTDKLRTVEEVMTSMKCYKVWDCGSIEYIKTKGETN